MTATKLDPIEQADRLLTDGKCDLPITWEDVASKVANHPSHGLALKRCYAGDSRLINMITNIETVHLCRAFCGEVK